EEAGQLVRSWRRLAPADPRSAHMLAALTGEDVPARASTGYVRAVFDRFAESFDEKLHSLDYRAPQLVTAAVEAALGTGRGDLVAILAAAGTALRRGGHFAFTVEHLQEDVAAGLRLNRHGRYSHTPAYVAATASAAGLSMVRSDGAALRMEAGEPVAGLVVVL